VQRRLFEERDPLLHWGLSLGGIEPQGALGPADPRLRKQLPQRRQRQRPVALREAPSEFAAPRARLRADDRQAQLASHGLRRGALDRRLHAVEARSRYGRLPLRCSLPQRRLLGRGLVLRGPACGGPGKVDGLGRLRHGPAFQVDQGERRLGARAAQPRHRAGHGDRARLDIDAGGLVCRQGDPRQPAQPDAAEQGRALQVLARGRFQVQADDRGAGVRGIRRHGTQTEPRPLRGIADRPRAERLHRLPLVVEHRKREKGPVVLQPGRLHVRFQDVVALGADGHRGAAGHGPAAVDRHAQAPAAGRRRLVAQEHLVVVGEARPVAAGPVVGPAVVVLVRGLGKGCAQDFLGLRVVPADRRRRTCRYNQQGQQNGIHRQGRGCAIGATSHAPRPARMCPPRFPVENIVRTQGEDDPWLGPPPRNSESSWRVCDYRFDRPSTRRPRRAWRPWRSTPAECCPRKRSRVRDCGNCGRCWRIGVCGWRR